MKSSKTAQTLELSRQKKEYNTKIALLTTDLQQEKKEKRKALLTSNSKDYTELREVKKKNVILQTQLEKKEKMNEEEQCKLIDAENKYDMLLAQSEIDKKSIGKLGRQLSAQYKTTNQSMDAMLDADKNREGICVRKIRHKKWQPLVYKQYNKYNLSYRNFIPTMTLL